MNKINFKNLKIIIRHPSFWKIIVIALVCISVFRKFSDTSNDTSKKQSVIPIVVELPVSQYTPVLKLSGFTQPKDHGILKANFKAVVEKLIIQKGRSVNKGDVVLTLLSPEVEKRLVEAKSRHKQRLAEYESAKKLTEKELKSENTFLASKADFEQSMANLQKAETDANELNVTAPEDGYLEECYVHEGDTVFAQDKLIEIVYKNAVNVRLYVSEDTVTSLKLGMAAKIKIGNTQYLGEVSGISNMADANTRNFYVDLTIKDQGNRFPFGATAEAVISLPTRKGFWINASALTLNDEGELGVKILENGKVVFVSVKLSSLAEEGAYIEYDAPSIGLIAYGGEFLLPGQTPTVHWQKNPTL